MARRFTPIAITDARGREHVVVVVGCPDANKLMYPTCEKMVTSATTRLHELISLVVLTDFRGWIVGPSIDKCPECDFLFNYRYLEQEVAAAQQEKKSVWSEPFNPYASMSSNPQEEDMIFQMALSSPLPSSRGKKTAKRQK